MRALALLAGLLFLASPIMAVPALDTPTPAADWRTKADSYLIDAVQKDAGVVSVEVVGPKLAMPDEPFATRGEWTQFFAERSAPFLASLRERAASLGGVVTAEIRAANAGFVRIDARQVPALLSSDDVRLGGLDYQGATFLLDAPKLPTADGPSVLTTLGQSLALHEVPALHALGFKGAGVSIAGIDTGIRGTHEMMRTAGGVSRVTGWYDATGTAGNPGSGWCATPCDTHFHGTHTITTAAGSNYFNMASPLGVAPDATVFGVRIFQGGGGSWEDAQEGLQAAFDLGADITTNSWGGGCSGGGVVTAELAEDLQTAGMNNVFAAGNSGTGGVICPGMVDNVVTVGAVDIGEVVAGFSSRGPCTWPVGSGNTRICPDVMGMGVDLVAGCQSSDTCYTSASGTSMATPHVAGVVVLLEQIKKATFGSGLSAPDKEAEIILRYTAKDLGSAGPDNNYGWGNTKANAARNLLVNAQPIDVRHIFSSGDAVIRAYQSNNLVFSLVNLGLSGVSGTLTFTVRQIDTGNCPPTCENVTIFNGPLSLPRLREFGTVYVFNGADHPAGNYLVEARYDFGSGVISRSGSFLLKKVDLRVGTDIPAASTSGTANLGTLTIKNVGNENATNVGVLEKWSDWRVLTPIPVVPPGVGPCGSLMVCPYGLFADPTPSSANPGYIGNPTTWGPGFYWWIQGTVGEVKAGGQWVAKQNFVSSTPGTSNFDTEVLYQDETGRLFVQHFLESKTVNPPV